ncbi:MAG: apolipoprotein N-acyltransferase, partial [Pseudomonadota bacterium]
VQPNILQKDKFKPEKAREILDRHLNLSRRITGPEDLGLLQTTHLIWPESAFPFLLTDYPTVLSEIGAMLPPGTTLLTGAVRAEPPAPGEAGRRFFNSLYAIDHTGAIDQAYDKVHLVPFGEYLPFEATLEGLGLLSFVEYPGGFNRGPSKRVLNVAGVPPVLPLICYEVIFPHDFDATKQIASAGWILNVTNDAWFGITSGPYQHFHQTRLRAVDEGLPVVRAANNGISAVIDGYGRVVKKLDLGEAGIIDAKLPERISVPLSDQMRTVIFVIMMITSFGLVFVRR